MRPFEFFESAAQKKKKRSATGMERGYVRRPSSLKIGRLIPNDKCAAGIALVLGECSQNHARIWLALGMIGVAVAVDRRVRMIRAEIESIDVGPDLRQVSRHLFVEAMHGRLIVISACDAGLVCDHDHEKAETIDESDRFASAGEPNQILRSVGVAFVDVERAIAVEEYDGT